MTRPPLIFIESNTSGTGRLFVSAARQLGFHPVLVTASPGRYEYLDLPDAPEVLTAPDSEENHIEDAIRSRFGGEIAGITSSSESFVATAAALAKRFGLPGPDAACVRAARDKSHQREVLAGAGFATPVFRVVEDVPSAITAARMTGFPVVLKPVDGTGSMGVRACVAERDVEVHAGLLFGRSNGSRTRLLVESFIEGEEFSVEVFSGRVVGITRKHLGDWPYFVESGHDYPAVLSASAAREISQTARSASNLLGLCWGPLHWEVRMQRGRAVVVEVNPRLAGGFIPELVRYAQGIDLIRATLRLVTGQRPELEPERHQSASIRFLMAPRAGIFVAAKGIGAAQSVPGVVDVRLYRAPGDELELQGDFRDRIGHVMASGDLPNVTSSAAEQARRMIRLRVETQVRRADS